MANAQAHSRLLEELPDGLPPCSAPHHAPLPSYWTSNYTSPLARRNASPSISLPTQADIVVIGGGITGTSAVSHLLDGLLASRSVTANRPTSIVMLEAREFCTGATGRHGGHLTPLPRLDFQSALDIGTSVEDVKKEVKLEDRSADFVIEICKREGWTQAVDLIYDGTVHLKDAVGDVRAHAELAAAAEAGVDVSSIEWIDARKAQADYQTKAYSATVSPGGNLYAMKLVTKLFQRAEEQAQKSNGRASLDLFTCTVVNNIVPNDKKAAAKTNPGRWRLCTSRGDITANYILHATNGYASHLIPSLASGASRIVPTRGQVVSIPLPLSSSATAPNQPRQLWHTSFSSTSGLHYFFQRPNFGPVILGGARALAGPEAQWEFGTTDDSAVNPKVGVELRRFLGRECEGFDPESDVELEWSGIIGYRANGCPMVGPVYAHEKPLIGQYIAAGYSGHGMTRAPACAEAVAGMILADLAGEAYVQPPWLPGHYLTHPEVSGRLQRWSPPTQQPNLHFGLAI